MSAVTEITPSTDTLALDTKHWAVVIPSYNHADDAINCLKSLRAADNAPERIILVDDASTENAVDRIAAWAAEDKIPYRIVAPTQLAANRDASPSPWLTIVAVKANSGF